MRKCAALVLSALLLTGAANAKVENFYEVKQHLTNYYNSGEYLKDITKVTSKAKATLADAINKHQKDDHLAVVIDIDETALSNIKLLLSALSLPFKVGDSVPQAFFDPFKHPYDSPAIEPVLDLYQFAVENNVAVFFISARQPEGQVMTEKNLRAAGYTTWNDVVLLSPEDINLTSEQFKTRSRKKITEEGFDVVLTIGDQNSDINGPYAGKTFLLPNPFYYTP